MGISTVASYTGAQIFEAIGLGHDVVDEFFTGTVSRLGGVGLDVLAEEVLARHRHAFSDNPAERSHPHARGRRRLPVGAARASTTCSTRRRCSSSSTRPARGATTSSRTTPGPSTTRRAASAPSGACSGSVPTSGRRCPLEEVESAERIIMRFSTGAMSYGSISAEAHETLAVAMNRIGGKSNTGEGGEDADRYTPDDNGDLRRSAIKQAASGRFGVTSEYLVNADDIQIKMAQGAKPGEGGQLPGHKVYPWIAKTRHSRRVSGSSRRRPITTSTRSRTWRS